MYQCFAQTSTFEGVVGKIWPRFLQVIAFRRPINCPHTSTSSLQKVDSICLAMQSPQQQRKKERKKTRLHSQFQKCGLFVPQCQLEMSNPGFAAIRTGWIRKMFKILASPQKCGQLMAKFVCKTVFSQSG